MSSDPIAIQVENLGKCYHIYNQPSDRLKQAIVPRISWLLGRPPSAYYQEFWALHDVSFEVRKGETVGVIGRNGAGKSTLLQLICGTLTPTIGSVQTRGRITALLELGSGFNPEFTGRENVFLNGAILGLSQDEISQRFDAIAAFADIGEFIEQPVKFYSSGMVVRLAFAVQAMVDPDILIVDEALAVGDERFQRKCFHRIEELKNNGTSILFVSHSAPQVVELCDRALLLEQGRRLLFSNPLDVTRAYHRLIYAGSEQYHHIVSDIVNLDQCGSGEQSRIFESVLHDELPSDDEQTDGSMTEIASSFSQELPAADHGLPEEDFFDAGMLAESTQILPEMGARVESVRILNSQGKQVNNLIPNREYILEIRGRFLQDQSAVRFASHIRTRTGLFVAGFGYPHVISFMHDFRKGQTCKLSFRFKANLKPDVYFISVGIWSAQEPSRLHQVLDLVMFRVLPKHKSYAWGLVDLTVGEPEFDVVQC